MLCAACGLREVPQPRLEPLPTSFAGWETARSRHFVLHTDAGVGAIAAILERFEDTYQALQATFFRQTDLRPIESLVFANADDYRAVAGKSAGRFLAGVGASGSLLVVRHTEDPDVLGKVVTHELAHRFVDAAFPILPNWLDEGIAVYFESVDVRDDEVLFGAAPRRASHGFQIAGGVSFTDLLHATPERLYGSEASFYYSASWALVHYLMNGREGVLRPRFRQLLAAVEQATRENRTAEGAFAKVYPDVSPAELDQAILRLTRGLDRMGVDVLARVPLRRAPMGPIERGPADPDQVRALAAAVQRRNWRAPEPEVDLAARPHFVRAEGQAGFHIGYLGAAYGHVFRAPFAWEVDLGLGPLGYQVAALARLHGNVGEGGNFFVSAGLGPMLALKSERLGNKVERHQDATVSRTRLHYFFGLQPEVAAEVRTPSHLIARISIGSYLRLAQNLSSLCDLPAAPQPESGCDPPDGRSGAQIGQAGWDLFARFGLGYSW